MRTAQRRVSRRMLELLDSGPTLALSPDRMSRHRASREPWSQGRWQKLSQAYCLLPALLVVQEIADRPRSGHPAVRPAKGHGMKWNGYWIIGVLIAGIGGAAMGADDPTSDIKPLASVKFVPDSDVKCLLSAIETGNPTTGRSTLILKAPSRCVVPWHSHTAEEQLIVITGNVISEMLDHKPARLGPGGFAVMGSRMPHQFTCLARHGCLMIVAFDGQYDIFWGRGR